MSIPRETLAKYITPRCRFVETGTRWGDTCIRAVELGAGSVMSCESDWIFYALAQQHIEDALRERAIHVHLFYETSEEFLADGVFLRVTTPVVLLLDAHTESHSPVLTELHLLERGKAPSVILIDDMRLFRDGTWRITEQQVIDAVKRVDPNYVISYDLGYQADDILVARLP